MPLRDLFYVSRVLQNLTKEDNLYGKMKVKIPTPRFIVFYNGMEEMPERITEKLVKHFGLTQEKAREYLQEYSQEK